MEQFLHDNSIFIVLAVILFILFGIAAYVSAIDRKLSKLEKLYCEDNDFKKEQQS